MKRASCNWRAMQEAENFFLRQMNRIAAAIRIFADRKILFFYFYDCNRDIHAGYILCSSQL